jgi:hypothetical protein
MHLQCEAIREQAARHGLIITIGRIALSRRLGRVPVAIDPIRSSRDIHRGAEASSVRPVNRYPQCGVTKCQPHRADAWVVLEKVSFGAAGVTFTTSKLTYWPAKAVAIATKESSIATSCVPYSRRISLLSSSSFQPIPRPSYGLHRGTYPYCM